MFPLRRIARAMLFAALSATAADAQATGNITGVVTDSATSRPVTDVQIAIEGTRFVALTDEAGRYMITGLPAGTYNIDARRIGFQRASITGVVVAAGQTVTANIALKASVLNLEAVVSTGVVDPTSGTRVPFTVGRVDAASLPVPATNALESIQGKMSGVSVSPAGQPGSGTNIILRTPTSISKSNSPLIVVDGVIQSAAFGASSADLESMDIESVEVIKGAAAASLYGSRAQSGVIQIRTRRGSGIVEGGTQFTLRSEMGSNFLGGNFKWAKAHYWRTNADGEYVDTLGNVVERDDRVERPAFERFQDVAYNVPIYDQVDRFFDPGQFYKNSISVAQNLERTNWFLSVVDTREDGVVLGSGEYGQRDLRLNLDHRPTDQFSFSVSGYHSSSNRNELYGDTFFDLINQEADIDLLQPDTVDGTRYTFQNDPDGREENPLYVLATEDSRRKRARTQGSIEGRYQPLSWLTLDGNVSYDRSDRRNNFFLDRGVKTEGFSADGGPGEISEVTGTTTTMNAAISANTLGRFGDFTVRSTLRGLMEREENQVTEAEGVNFAVPGVRSLDNATERFVESTFEEIRASGFFVSLGADYQGKYIADALLRRDGSSLFGPNERWNSYYRLSGAYRLTEEDWWQWPSFSELKLRVSQGTAGGRPDFNDQYETFVFNTGGGVTKATLGNANLKPELSTETEFGIDAIIRDRYSVQLSYAKTKVVDQLLQVPLAALYGYTSQWRNAGTVEGNTIEATVEAQIMRRPDFSWTMGFVADRSRHSITEFDLPCFTRSDIAFICQGSGLSEMYGFSLVKNVSQLPASAQPFADEFDVNDEGILVWVGQDRTYRDGVVRDPVSGAYVEPDTGWGMSADVGGTTYGWGMPIRRLNPDGSLMVSKIGDGNPDFRWGWSNSVTWKSFDFFGLVDAQVGGDAYNQTMQRMFQWGRTGYADQTGKPDGLKKTIDYTAALYMATSPVDYFVEDASYVKLRELSVRYRLGGRLLSSVQQFGATGVSLSLVGRNLLTFSNYKGYDPEVGGSTVKIDSFDYPRYRTITGSIQITF